MNRARMLLSRLFGAFGSRRREKELDEELRTHLSLLAEEHQRHGLSREEAELAARRDLGGLVRTRESYREQRGLPFLESLLQDVRYAFRMWRHAPGFNLAIVAILMFGIGANSAMFTFVNALLFRPLAGRASEFVGVYSHDPSKPASYRNFSYPNYVDIRDRSDVFDHLVAFTFSSSLGRDDGDLTDRPLGVIVSENYFFGLGIQMTAGRPFTAEESKPGADIAVVVVDYPTWERTGFNPAIVGRTTRLNSRDFTIIGVAPKAFTGTLALIAPELWLPLGIMDTLNTVPAEHRLNDRANPRLWLAGLMKPSLTLEQANARLAPLAAELARAYPAENQGQVLTVHPMSRVNISGAPSSDSGPAAMSAVLMPLTGSVLLVACLNIGTMLLARGTARKKEIAIRLALGGGRSRVVRQLLTENLMLSLTGAGLGLALGTWLTRLLLASAAPVLPVPLQLPVEPDANILIVTVGFAVLSAFAFGLAPALKTTRADLVGDLKDQGAAMSGPGVRIRRRGWPVVCQIAVSLALLTAGGFCAHAALRAAAMDPGFPYERLLLAEIDPALAGYDESRQRERLATSLARLRQLSGISSVAASTRSPYSHFQDRRYASRPGRKDVAQQTPYYAGVTSDYFSTLGLPVLRGREFTRAEEGPTSTAKVAIIDEPLAQQLFGHENPVGQFLTVPKGEVEALSGDHTPLEIVGVVPGLREDLDRMEPAAHLYVPTATYFQGSMELHLRTQGGSDGEMLAAVRRELREVDGNMPVVQLQTEQQNHDNNTTLWLMRTAGQVLGGLGLLALVLAVVGLYGVKSFNVAQRTKEIGVRLTLGARPREIALMLLRDDAKVTLLGIAIGLPLAIGLGQLLSGAMFRLDVYDPVILIAAPLVLIVSAALATYLPARRAMRVSPLTALRHE